MTKAEIITQIIAKTGIEKPIVTVIVESLMDTMEKSMIEGNEIFFRGFGSFILKKRALKTGRNITKGTTIKIPAHMIPAFKPCKEFVTEVKSKVKVK
jgi:DNA-binding protein HU-beta